MHITSTKSLFAFFNRLGFQHGKYFLILLARLVLVLSKWLMPVLSHNKTHFVRKRCMGFVRILLLADSVATHNICLLYTDFICMITALVGETNKVGSIEW